MLMVVVGSGLRQTLAGGTHSGKWKVSASGSCLAHRLAAPSPRKSLPLPLGHSRPCHRFTGQETTQTAVCRYLSDIEIKGTREEIRKNKNKKSSLEKLEDEIKNNAPVPDNVDNVKK